MSSAEFLIGLRDQVSGVSRLSQVPRWLKAEESRKEAIKILLSVGFLLFLIFFFLNFISTPG